MDTSNFKEVFESPKVKELTAQVAALELEVVSLRSVIADVNDVGLEHFAALVAAAEREACADLCDKSDRYRGCYFAAKIRERKEQV